MELAIVKYIKEHGLAKAIKDFSLKSRIYQDKILLKYDQLNSPFGNREVEECRGLILERDTWRVMSLGLTKFYNSAEGHAAKIGWDTARVLKKEDGCCHRDTILKTEDGDMTIKEICDTEYAGKVLSYDIESGETVYDEIVAHSTKNNIDNWYEIELEDGTTIKLTANHKVWLPNLNCYRAVENLTEDDEFLVLNISDMEYIKCVDKFGNEVKDGDLVDIQKAGAYKVYKKNSQLYFKPYGEEERVSAYFSNDMVKCDEDGCWLDVT